MSESITNPNYWAYKHSNGTLQIKRWFGDHKDYTTDCENNPFVAEVMPPFHAGGMAEASRIARAKLYPLSPPGQGM